MAATPEQMKEAGQVRLRVHEMIKIDRLSLLPNELLDKIFDYAHTLDQPSTGPLSKRLLPFLITGIYRRIKVSKVTKLLRLAAKLNAEPHLGEGIRTLQFDTAVTLNNESNYEELLQALPHHLIELELVEEAFSPERSFCDHLLPHFTRLRRLVLGNTLFSDDLVTHLGHPSLLEHLESGEGSIPIHRLHSLVSGSTRLPSLHTLYLDLIPHRIGTRIEVGENGSLTEGNLSDVDALIGDDWHLAEFECDDGDEYTVKGLVEFVRLAKEEGIEIEGPILKAGEARQAYLLEVANIVVYQPQMMYGAPQQSRFGGMGGGGRMGGGGMGMGGAALGAGAGLLGGAMLMNAWDNNQEDAYRDGYQDGQQDDNGGGDDFGGDDGGGDF
ncbi:uncharacterized protein JCM6883_006794 [Sporobolomyces salmoneus]|uniref:uncharacterized protein n=1 Tax=Sporobolomyces salmoneus TaxID=183962 RepID=UPI00317FA151